LVERERKGIRRRFGDLGEIAVGILILPRGRKRAQLQRWFDAVISRRWAELIAKLRKKGDTLPILDSMIAATALAHGLTVATHNVRDFQKAGVPVLDPFV
jgi:toxin FitB